jgi:polyisoprenoid-binding protein YceI
VFEPREDLVEHYDSVLNQFEEALNSDEKDDEDDSIDGEMEIEEIQEGTKRVLH